MASVPQFALIGIALAATAASTAVSASGKKKAGREEQEAANLEAADLDQQAGQTRAVAQRRAEQIDRQSERLFSRQKALQAATGFAGDDVSALETLGETKRVSTYEQLLAKAEGEDQARALEFQAQQTRISGLRARRAANREALGTIIGGVAQIASTAASSFGGGSGSSSGSSSGGGARRS